MRQISILILTVQGKKDAAQIFNNVLRRQIGTRTPTVEYICTSPEIVFTLCRGYEHQEIALNCGTMLRECIRYETLAKIILYSEHFYDFFKYATKHSESINSLTCLLHSGKWHFFWLRLLGTRIF